MSGTSIGMPIIRLAILAAGVLFATITAAQAATSAITDAFVAATAPAYAALLQADGLAESAGSHLVRFARRDSAEQAEATGELRAWQEATRRADIAAAHAPSIDGLGPALYPLDAVVLPFNIHGKVDSDPYRLTLTRLGALGGADFDALYLPTEAAILQRLTEVYIDYIKNGDEPGLRRLAVRNLPIVRRLLGEINRS